MTARLSPGRVSNAPLRELFLASPVTASEVARQCGWPRFAGAPGGSQDTTKVRRLLGLTDYKTTRGGKVYRSFGVTVSIEDAQMICLALGVDFDQVYAELEEEACGECKLCGAPMLEPDPEDTCGLCWWEIEQLGHPDEQWMVAA